MKAFISRNIPCKLSLKIGRSLFDNPNLDFQLMFIHKMCSSLCEGLARFHFTQESGLNAFKRSVRTKKALTVVSLWGYGC